MKSKLYILLTAIFTIWLTSVNAQYPTSFEAPAFGGYVHVTMYDPDNSDDPVREYTGYSGFSSQQAANQIAGMYGARPQTVIHFNPNRTTTTISGNFYLQYTENGYPSLIRMWFTQPAIPISNYGITPTSLEVNRFGGNYTITMCQTDMNASIPIRDFERTYTGYSDPSGQITGIVNNGKTITVSFKANAGVTTITNNFTIYYLRGGTVSESQTISFSQLPAALKDLGVTPTELSVDPSGGSHTITMCQTDPYAIPVKVDYKRAYTGYHDPSGQITGIVDNVNTITVSFKTNASRVTKTSGFTIYYRKDGATNESAYISFSQPSIAPTDYGVVPTELSVDPEGGSHIITMCQTDSTIDKLDFERAYTGYSDPSGQVAGIVNHGSTITVSFKKNASGATKTSGFTIFYLKDGITSESEYISFTQPSIAPTDYGVVPTELSVDPSGSSHIITMCQTDSTIDKLDFERAYTGYSDPSGQISGIVDNGRTITISFKANETGTTKTNYFTIYYLKGGTTSESVYFLFSQLSVEPTDYGVTPTLLSVDPSGGSHIITMCQTNLNADPPKLDYERTYTRYDDPSEQITGIVVNNGSTITVSFKANASGETKTNDFTIYYLKGGTVSESTTISFSQPSQPPVTEQPSISYLTATSISLSDNFTTNADISSKNYILKKTYLTASPVANSLSSYAPTVAYYDGMGRALQMIEIGASGDGKDLVTHMAPDFLDREDAISYIPYKAADATGRFQTNALSAQQSQYGGASVRAYSEKIYECSPLNRVLATVLPGFTTADKTQMTIAASAANEVLKLTYDPVSATVFANNYYPAGAFTKTTTTTPDGAKVEVFVNELGSPVLEKRSVNSSQNADTYYVYDSRNRLVCVIPPQQAFSIGTTTANYSAAEYYTYAYDSKDRVSKRKLPGMVEERLEYNAADMVIKIERGTGASMVTISTTYDAFNRPTAENYKYGAGGAEVNLAQYFYDNTSAPANLAFAPVAGIVEAANVDPRTTGLKVYEKVRVLPGSEAMSAMSTAGTYIERAYYYDYRGRIVQTVEKNHLGGISRTSYRLDFAGNVLSEHQSHQSSASAAAEVMLKDYTYDNRSRILTETSHFRSNTAIVSYTYNELGQLSEKKYGDSSQSNLFTDGSFETGYNTIWSPRNYNVSCAVTEGGGTYRGVYPIFGNKMITAEWGDVDSYFYIDQVIPVTPGKEYHISFWACSGGEGGNSSSFIYDSQDHHYNKPLNFSSGWTPQEWSFTAPEGVTWIQIRFGRYGNGAGWSCFDNIQIREGKVVTETLSYTLQGWLASQISPLFISTLRYQNPVKATASAAGKVGNITEWEWTQSGQTANTYSLSYDKLSRLTDASQYVGETVGNRNTEKGLTYDLNGNILSLQRYAAGALVDDLSYAYTGNRLTTLTENAAPSTYDIYARGASAAGTYSYDEFGNMKNDSRKNLDFAYNFLNLIRRVSDASNISIVKALYDYDAAGRKLSVVGSTTNGYEYLGSLIYYRNGNDRTVESAGFAGGRILAATSPASVLYNLTDHLGSVRVIFDAAGTVVERNDYYPLGESHLNGAFPQFAANRFKFNGKELQTTGGLGSLDYGARAYDKQLGRWFVSDPLAEKYYGTSPYAYAVNNPVRYVDPDGRKIVDANGNLMWANGKWTQYATAGAMRIGIAMRATETGLNCFNRIASSDAAIQVELSNETIREGGTYTLGVMKEGKLFPESGEMRELKSGKIVVYKGSIEAFLNNSDKMTDKEAREAYKGASIDEVIGSIGGHEAEHTTDENVTLQINKVPLEEIEKKPTEVGMVILNEYERKKRKNELDQ